MALRGVVEHPKFSQLKSILGAGKGETLGYLEATWHFCGRFAMQGNIGKFSDAEIESWIEWKGDPGKLIAALVQSRWLDVSGRHRLIVHDWHDHADQTTKKTLGQRKLPFFSRTDLQLVKGSSGTLPEDFRNTSGQAGAGAVPVPVPEAVAGLLEVLERRWDLHKKYRGTESKQLALQVITGKIDAGKLTVADLDAKHECVVDYWDQKGWDFCGYTLLEWIELGMPDPRPKARDSPAKPTPSKYSLVPKGMRDPFVVREEELAAERAAALQNENPVH